MFKLPANMAGLKTFTIALAMVLLSIALSGQRAAAIHHHVVGDDLAAWASTRVFKVGDNIWFANTASKESLVELESVDEFSSCDLTNPIKMYTEDINKVSLDGEGSRYFVSSDPESCKKGLKLHIHVHPNEEETNEEGVSSSEEKDVTPEEKDDTNPHSSSEDEDVPDVAEPPPSPKPKPKPPRKAPPPEDDPDVGPDSPPEPIYPPPTPSSSALFNGLFLAVVALACWVAI